MEGSSKGSYLRSNSANKNKVPTTKESSSKSHAPSVRTSQDMKGGTTFLKRENSATRQHKSNNRSTSRDAHKGQTPTITSTKSSTLSSTTLTQLLKETTQNRV